MSRHWHTILFPVKNKYIRLRNTVWYTTTRKAARTWIRRGNLQLLWPIALQAPSNVLSGPHKRSNVKMVPIGKQTQSIKDSIYLFDYPPHLESPSEWLQLKEKCSPATKVELYTSTGRWKTFAIWSTATWKGDILVVPMVKMGGYYYRTLDGAE